MNQNTENKYIATYTLGCHEVKVHMMSSIH